MRLTPLARPVALALAVPALLVASACAPVEEEDTTTDTTTESPSGSPTADACGPDAEVWKEPGTLTVGTDSPAYEPWFSDNDPSNGKGFESAVAYAVAEQLGFAAEDVQWIKVPFNNSYAPGEKKFDFDINQISYDPKRAEAVDFSDSYYDVEQAVVTIEGSKIASAGSIDDLKGAKLGAQIGTTSLDAINDRIQPSAEPSVYDTNNDAISALKAKQIDGIVVDFPTALYMAAVQLDNGKVVGRLSAEEADEYFGVVLEKDSPLTECVNDAIQEVKDDGTLDELEQKWLTGSAPVLE